MGCRHVVFYLAAFFERSVTWSGATKGYHPHIPLCNEILPLWSGFRPRRTDAS